METLGLRHAALYVRDPQASKAFYEKVLGMTVEWEPDADNVYLTSGGQDNLAIHRRADEAAPAGSDEFGYGPAQRLDHLGFALPTIESVDAWYERVKGHGAKILRDVKTHRDGARSFYFSDLDGTIIQVIYHPPIAARAAGNN